MTRIWLLSPPRTYGLYSVFIPSKAQKTVKVADWQPIIGRPAANIMIISSKSRPNVDHHPKLHRWQEQDKSSDYRPMLHRWQKPWTSVDRSTKLLTRVIRKKKCRPTKKSVKIGRLSIFWLTDRRPTVCIGNVTVEYNIALWLIPQSYHPNQPSPDGRRAKFGKIGRRQSIVGRFRHRILADFLVGRRFSCRITKVKSVVNQSAHFLGICLRGSVWRWSLDNRPTVGRLFKNFLSWYRQKVISRQSIDDLNSIGRWHFFSNICRQTPNVRWSSDCRPIIKFGLYCIAYKACIHIILTLNLA